MHEYALDLRPLSPARHRSVQTPETDQRVSSADLSYKILLSSWYLRAKDLCSLPIYRTFRFWATSVQAQKKEIDTKRQ